MAPIDDALLNPSIATPTSTINEVRSIDGAGNNLDNPELGRSGLARNRVKKSSAGWSKPMCGHHLRVALNRLQASTLVDDSTQKYRRIIFKSLIDSNTSTIPEAHVILSCSSSFLHLAHEQYAAHAIIKDQHSSELYLQSGQTRDEQVSRAEQETGDEI